MGVPLKTRIMVKYTQLMHLALVFSGKQIVGGCRRALDLMCLWITSNLNA